MNEIIVALLNRYRSEAHYEFMENFNGKRIASPVVDSLVHPLVAEFEEQLQKERNLVDAQRKNPYTERIAEADKQDDKLIVAIKEIISANMKSVDPTIVAAAIKLDNRMKAFKKIESKSYEEEAAAASILVSDLLSPTFATDVNMIGLTNWILQLETSVNIFKNLLQERNDSIAPTLTQDNLKTVRRKIDIVYHKMVTRINAAAELDNTGQYDTFIQQLNAEIRYFNEHTHISAKKDIGLGDHTVIDPIPVQIYTGQAITPIPVVHYREENKETVTLAFAKDFSLLYKNNLKPGMAEIIVRGKGAYKGRKITTFNIIHHEE
ncbi:MAG: DUF6261 family protein [Bacteroidales bacterium]|jgi:hypothetical protein|nr:DUF6261 family protein [Bacteroidales bacterium]